MLYIFILFISEKILYIQYILYLLKLLKEKDIKKKRNKNKN